MSSDIEDFSTLMTLEPSGENTWSGNGPTYPWGRVYGGQVAAQALRAAFHTVDAHFSPHSLHAYFLASGKFEEPIHYRVEILRDGRSFVTRRVVAHQASSPGPMLELTASFQIREDQANVQELSMPEGLPKPEELPAADWGPILERRTVPTEGPRQACWLRVPGPLADDAVTQSCALAYASDDIPTEAGSKSHPRALVPGLDESYDEVFVGASLDHTIWFHRPGRHDDWTLHDFQSVGLAGARGLAVGQVFSRGGVHLATVAQEILLRERTR